MCDFQFERKNMTVSCRKINKRKGQFGQMTKSMNAITANQKTFSNQMKNESDGIKN